MSAPSDKEQVYACQNLYQELVECLVMTECVRNGGKLPDCLKDKQATPECQGLRHSYFECRKAQVFFCYCYAFLFFSNSLTDMLLFVDAG
jgi:hypothetical protein